MSKKVTVAHFYAGNFKGGLEKALTQILNLKPAGIQQKVLLNYDSYLANQLRDMNNEPVIVGGARVRNPFSLIVLTVKLILSIKKLNSKIFVSHDVWNYTVSVIAQKLAGQKSVLWFHTEDFNYPLLKVIDYFPPDLAICNSQHTLNKVKKKWPSIHSENIYYPFPIPDILPEAEAVAELRGMKGDNKVILYCGRITPYKGLERLAQSFHKMDLSNTVLWIVGAPQTPFEDKYLSKVKEILSKKEMDGKVIYWGYQDNPLKFFRVADVFCQPNIKEEAFGLVFLEALSQGCPIVTSETGGAKEILGDILKGVILTPPNVISELSYALKNFIENPMSEQEKLYLNEHAKSFNNISDSEYQMEYLFEDLIE